MAESPRIQPQRGPQEAYLENAADIAIYGGAAGGGKTWALLVEALRHTGNPRFGAVIFRRTSPQITNEGGLWDESMQLYPLARGTPKVGSLDWSFPSGANIGFRHLQHEADKLAWQGAQVALIGFDELTHFSSSQFFYLLSRNRSLCGIRPYVRATTNPDAASWVKTFLAPWVDRRFAGRPAKSGELRWFIRDQGQITWVPEGTPDAKSVTFVRASLFDNRILMTKDPGYLANLKALPAVERARLLDGDWDARREGLVFPGLVDCIVEPLAELPVGTAYGGIDFGFHNPFAALAAVLDHDDVLWVHWERYRRNVAISEHARALPRGSITWFADPAGADQIAELRRADHVVRLGINAVEAGIDRVNQRIRTGRLKVYSTCRATIEESGLYAYRTDGVVPGPEDVSDDAARPRREEPIDMFNHAMSALRYMIASIDRRRAVEVDGPPETHEPIGHDALADGTLQW